jgi:molybdate transport system regulatory protein
MNSELIGRTWDKLAGKHEEVMRAFYDRFFERYPDYKHLFAESLDRQLGKMLETMAFLARVSDETEITHPKMVRLGERHSQFRLSAEDLEKFKIVFVEILAQYCGNEWNADYQQAWDDVFEQRVIPHMTEGLKPSTPTPSPTQLKSILTRTSIRNELVGTVTSVKPRMYQGEVILTLKGGDEIHAVLTLNSISRLGLTEGRQTHILIRAPHLILAKPNCGMRFSAGNRLCGKVVHVLQARLTAEVTLELKGGDFLKAIVPQEAIADLSIQTGEELCGIFKSSNVVLAVESE